MDKSLESSARRKLMLMLAVVAASSMLPRWSWALSEDESLKQFIALSQLLTGTDQLDTATAQHILQIIQAEPWGKEHLKQVSDKVFPAQGSRTQILQADKFTDGERWFISHFLTTWFTGVYYHQRGNQVVTYPYALMHAAIQEIKPIPGQCSAPFGAWSELPPGVKA